MGIGHTAYIWAYVFDRVTKTRQNQNKFENREKCSRAKRSYE